MLIFNHPLLESEKFYKIDSKEDISNTPPNSIVRFKFSANKSKIIKYCSDNSVPCAVDVVNITEAILASNLGANYIIVSENNVSSIQKIAETYLFDAKIVAISEDIEKIALLGIDGIIIKN